MFLCWQMSSRTPLVDLQDGSGQSEAPYSLSCPCNVSFPPSETFSRIQLWGNKRPSGWYTLMNLAKASVQTFKILMGGIDIFLSCGCPRQASYVSLLMKTATYLEWSASLVSSGPPCMQSRLWTNTLLLRSVKSNFWKVINNEYSQSEQTSIIHTILTAVTQEIKHYHYPRISSYASFQSVRNKGNHYSSLIAWISFTIFKLYMNCLK